MKPKLVLLLLLLWPGLAAATYSIIACDPATGRCGVAVATHNLAVGASVPFATAGVAAGVSQFETNPHHRPAILAALAEEKTAAQALERGLQAGRRFNDGAGLADRQVAVVTITGDTSAHTGANAGAAAGHLAAPFVAVQGNGLASDEVLRAMLTTYQTTPGPLAEKLLVALEAGEAAGGQRIGVMSAALLVATPEGWPLDIDLRVDFAAGSAIGDLRESYNAVVARSRLFQAFRAQRRGDGPQASGLAKSALALAPNWDRIWLNAAKLARSMNDRDALRLRYCQFARLNPTWAVALAEDFRSVTCREALDDPLSPDQ
ncbi:MAG: DUF1028 domain-containing protein [Pseudomonadota bacterium]